MIKKENKKYSWLPGLIATVIVFSVWEWYFIDILNLSSHTWDISLSIADIYRAVSKVVFGPRPTWTTMSSGYPIYHERHLLGRVHVVTMPRLRCEQPWVQATPYIMRDICPAVSNVVTGPRPCPMKSPGHIRRDQSWDQATPIYELLYEFTLHCHLLGNLSIRTSPFWQQWFQISRNSKH